VEARVKRELNAHGLIRVDACLTDNIRFAPPAYWPGSKDPSLITLAMRMRRSQIEGWPRAVFELESYAYPMPGAPIYVSAPEAVRTVLGDDGAQFSQGHLFRRIMRPSWGERHGCR
jgi:hypothetical protein